jgi:hypothetical protein
MTKRIAVGMLVVAAVLLTACATPLWGQAGAVAQISGTVSDPSGAVVPNAKVTATQTATGLVRTTLSGLDGLYVLPNLPVGPYKLEVEVGGFETYIQSGIVLEASNNVAINVTLHVGQAKQRVEVTADASMVQTQTTSVGQVMDDRRIVDLPLNGRIATSLIMLTGMSTDAGLWDSDLVTSKNYWTSDSISVAGGQESATTYRLDGGIHMDNFSNVNLPFPFPDAIQEFSVQTSSLAAQAGVHPGAQVEVVTKSGTNQFHGDAFEFVRNGDFDARDFYAATQDTLRQNQFGGTIGGPVKKDKLFGFFGYQGTRIRTAPPSNIAHVPTQAVLSGDWSEIESATCQSSGVARTIINPATSAPYANDYVDPSLYNQQALNMLKYVPTSSDPCGELTYAIPMPQREDQYVGRVDWNQSTKHNMFGRYFFSDYKSPAAFDNDFLLTTQRGVLDRAQSATLGDTYSITPNTLNSAHLTWTRTAVTRGPAADMKNLADFGVNMYEVVPNALDLSVTGYYSVGDGNPGTFRGNIAELSDSVDLMRGRHHMSLGGDWIHYEYPYNNIYLANGSVTFDGQFTNDGLLDYLLGLDSFFTQGNPCPFDGRQNYVGAYFNDNIQLNKRLNVNLGLRWEPNLPVTEVHNALNHFSQTAFAGGIYTNQFINAPPGVFFPGDPGIPRGYTYSKLSAFGPRVGIVWDPTGSGRHVFRLGYGVFFDTIPTANFEDQTQGAPWSSIVDLPSPPGGLTSPWQGYPGGDPFPLPYPPGKNAVFPPETTLYNFPLDSHPMYVNEWDLSYEHQLTANWLFSVNYLGNKTTHIWTGEDMDPAISTPAVCAAAPGGTCTVANENQRRVLYLINPIQGAKISDIYVADSGSNGEYEALYLKLQHRFSQHYTILANYTWSHCISEGDYQGDLGGPETQNPFDRNAERGNCGFDIRHIFNLSFIAQTPRFANAWVNRLAGNWQLSPIVAVHSGTWFNLFDGTDNSMSGVGLDRPNAVGNNAYVRSTTGMLQWLNPNAFVFSAPGTFGNSGMGALEAPGSFDIDAALSRYFNIKEKQRLELRFEFFNLTNHVNFGTPDNTLTDATFGQILGDAGPRILQFALKYTF